MNTYKTVEDYIEVIAGLKDPVTLKSTSSFFLGFSPIISLARYDTDVLDNMSSSTFDGKALTEKQGELAVKIILKYARQLASKDIDVKPVENPNWRHPLRTMDYSRKLTIADDFIVLEFPFKKDFIDSIREFKSSSQGGGQWHKETRQWKFALTEYNLVWLTTWAEQNSFTISDQAKQLNKMIADVEAQGFKIELELADGGVAIINAPESLLEYIESNCGGLEATNLLKLVDMAPVLGYTVSKEIADSIVAEYGPRVYSLLTNNEVKLDPTTYNLDSLASVLDYADTVGRSPVVIYEPNMTNSLLKQLESLRPADEIQHIKHKNTPVQSGVKYIHTVTPITELNSVPLLISGAGMLFGGDKNLMIQQTEKAVYCAADVYNNKKHTIELVKI